MKRLFILLAVLALVNALPAYAAEPETSDGITKTFEYQYPLSNSMTQEIAGVENRDGSCRFTYPTLTLEADETAIEARPVKVDLDSCVQTVEIGTPPASSLELPDGGTSHVATFAAKSGGHSESPDGSSTGGAALLGGGGSATVYHETRWEDKVHYDTSRTRAYLDWTWNGSCVTSSSAWGHYWWQSGTGWSKVSDSGYKTTSCNNHRSVVDWVHYMNNSFCALAGVEVDTWVNDSWARGRFDGSVQGGISGTWTTETPGNPNNCPDLHYHTVLVNY